MIRRLTLLIAASVALTACQPEEKQNETATTEATSSMTTSGASPSAGTAPSDNWVTTSTGLMYQDETEGTGDVATAGKTVSVHYTGWLENGTKFDSSRDRGQPFEFPLGQGQVIAGWDEGVAGMKEGGKRKLKIPAKLGYGESGAPPTIPPNSTLLFDVELLDVK